jgi:hypothetical protein
VRLPSWVATDGQHTARHVPVDGSRSSDPETVVRAVTEHFVSPVESQSGLSGWGLQPLLRWARRCAISDNGSLVTHRTYSITCSP